MNENEEQTTQEIETPAGAEETTQEEALPEIVTRIRSEYEAKIATITEQHSAEIKERDDIIAQLIGGNNQDNLRKYCACHGISLFRFVKIYMLKVGKKSTDTFGYGTWLCHRY